MHLHLLSPTYRNESMFTLLNSLYLLVMLMQKYDLAVPHDSRVHMTKQVGKLHIL